MGASHSSRIPKLFWPEISAHVPLTQTQGSTSVLAEHRTIRELVEDHCPSLYKPFNPVWWLFNGHAQTMYSVVGDFSEVDKVSYDRVLLGMRDGGTIGLDFTPPESEGRNFADDTPVIVALHGLTGAQAGLGSYESYLRAILAPAITPLEEGGLGYRAVVVNSRGCAGVPLTSPELYCAGRTTDIRCALLYIQTKYPKAPLLGVGFSLGSAILTKYLSEEGEESRLVSGCGVAVPWDMLAMCDRLTNNFFDRNVYSRALGRNCQALLARHASAIEQWPDSYLAKITPVVCSKPTLFAFDFDDMVSCVVGGPSPPWPLKGAIEFYKHVTPNQYLPQVRVPYLGLDSEDDPITSGTPIDSTNPWVGLAKTAAGGHLGWFENEDGVVKRWIRKPVLEWFKMSAEHISPDHRRPREILSRDGWLLDSGNEGMGVRVVQEGGLVKGAEPIDDLLAGL
ncbi:AB-hydrolase YheT [Vararia minispora EC-137]|uniref:AB-hydrolase YheT n=1 Tax=Vararia minispora EC-137 TaxID=1314806 RepID=A0ACB8QJ32_9AGAM|nr:AB-hydrolase YheT [Vararia minispora EC-137]